MSRRCALLTTVPLAPPAAADALVCAPLRRRGWRVESVPWRTPADWSRFDVVVIRSTWDYQHALDAFLGVLAEIDRSGARLENALDLVRWNARKTYLRDLAERGVRVVPSQWALEGLTAEAVEAAFARWDTDTIVVKPVVGASAGDTFRVRRGEASGWAPAVEALGGCPAMAQPFVPGIVEEGEYSLFYFDGRYSHAVLKRPAAGDYRVQEELGGSSRPVAPDADLTAAATAVLALLPDVPLYARVDLVRAGGAPTLMELELIEPALYLGVAAHAAERFAEAIAGRAE